MGAMASHRWGHGGELRSLRPSDAATGKMWTAYSASTTMSLGFKKTHSWDDGQGNMGTHIAVCLPVCLPVCESVFLSTCLPLFLCLPVCNPAHCCTEHYTHSGLLLLLVTSIAVLIRLYVGHDPKAHDGNGTQPRHPAVIIPPKF